MVAGHVLVDPLSNKSFVYKLTGNGFILYSKGINSIDEDGRSNGGADDWIIWPPRRWISQSNQKDEGTNNPVQTSKREPLNNGRVKEIIN